MRNIKALINVLRKNTEMKLPKKGSKATMYMSLGIIALCCIMIPCCLIVGYVSYVMTLALVEAGAPTAGIMAEIHIMSAFSLIFGMLVIFNILFFSSDREHLMPLPFKGYEILTAKFFYAYMAESVMEFLVLISMFTGYYLAGGISVLSILAGVVGVFIIPLMPLAFCAIISLILLRVLRNVKNSRLFGHISTILLFGFVALFLFSFKGMGGITVDNYVNSLASGNNLFSDVLSKIFFSIPFLMKTLESDSLTYGILNLLACIGLNAVTVAVMIVIGKYTYMDSLQAVGAMGSGKKSNALTDYSGKRKSVWTSYLSKEIKVLLRTKAYSGNCVFINYLWPLLMIGYLFFNRNKPGVVGITEYLVQKNERAYVLLTLVMVLLAFIASAMNSLASTAFTREGQHVDLLKYIPVPYKTQAMIKGFISIAITYPALLLCDIALMFFFKISIGLFLYYAIVILASLIITTIIGLYLDSSHPHVTWEDEYSALRGNLNTFFDMAIVMVLAGIICGSGFLIFFFTSMGFGGFLIYISIAIFIGTIVIWGTIGRKIPANMEKM